MIRPVGRSEERRVDLLRVYRTRQPMLAFKANAGHKGNRPALKARKVDVRAMGLERIHSRSLKKAIHLSLSGAATDISSL